LAFLSYILDHQNALFRLRPISFFFCSKHQHQAISSPSRTPLTSRPLKVRLLRPFTSAPSSYRTDPRSPAPPDTPVRSYAEAAGVCAARDQRHWNERYKRHCGATGRKSYELTDGPHLRLLISRCPASSPPHKDSSPPSSFLPVPLREL
jgi:hypothetical protein